MIHGGNLTASAKRPLIVRLSYGESASAPPEMDYESALKYTTDVDILRRNLSVAEPNSCCTALYHLSQLGDRAKSALPELKRLLQATSHPILRMKCAQMIAEIAPEECALILPILTAGLDDEDASVVQWAAFGLKDLGPAAAVAVPRVKQLLKGRDDFIRISLAEALVSITADEHDFVLPILMQLLQEIDEVFHDFVFKIFGDIGPKAVSSVPRLQKFLSDEDPSKAMEASIALGKITGDWTAAFNVGIRLFRSPESLYDFIPQDQWESLGILAQEHWELLGIHARGGIPLLEAEREMVPAPVRILIEEALEKIRGLPTGDDDSSQ